MMSKTTTTMLTSQWYKKLKSLFLLTAMFSASLVAEAKIFLVAVGISDYPGTENDLRLSHNDAATMHWLYKQNKHAETALLMNDKATVKNVKAAMQNMFCKATANDIVVLFFSGHGVKGGFVCYDSFLRYGDIKAAMSSCQSNNKMIFADACFSGAIRKSGSGTTSDYTSMKNSNLMLFLSCRTNETSIEREGMTNGFFTYALQHGLRGGADKNKDRIITAKELFNYVSAKVKKNSNNRQHPVMWGKFSDNMAVMRW